MSTRRFLPVYFGLFAPSGVTGLVFEVVWLRRLAIVSGATAARGVDPDGVRVSAS